jgi:hypothetical protein
MRQKSLLAWLFSTNEMRCMSQFSTTPRITFRWHDCKQGASVSRKVKSLQNCTTLCTTGRRFASQQPCRNGTLPFPVLSCIRRYAPREWCRIQGLKADSYVSGYEMPAVQRTHISICVQAAAMEAQDHRGHSRCMS